MSAPAGRLWLRKQKDAIGRAQALLSGIHAIAGERGQHDVASLAGAANLQLERVCDDLDSMLEKRQEKFQNDDLPL